MLKINNLARSDRRQSFRLDFQIFMKQMGHLEPRSLWQKKLSRKARRLSLICRIFRRL